MYFEALSYYLIIINILTFIMFGVDKSNAVHGKWRIRELVLLFHAFIGGSLGGILAMKIFHHKTQKGKFSFGLPIILLFHILVIVYLTKRFL